MENNNAVAFNESEWIRMVFMIRDMRSWMDEIEKGTMRLVPIEGRRKLFKTTYRLSATTMAHILEKHYYKIHRHPEASKFTIPLHEILHYIREAGELVPVSIPGSLNFERIVETDKPVGFDISGETVYVISVITDQAGYVKAAFPGKRIM